MELLFCSKCNDLAGVEARQPLAPGVSQVTLECGHRQTIEEE